MKEKWKKLLKKIKNPPLWAQLLTYGVTVVSAVGALLILLVEYTGNALEIVAYTLFGLAAISLSYSVYLIVRMIPRLKKLIILWTEKYEFTHSLLRNFGFRTIIFSIGSFLMSIAFGAFNAGMGIAYRSIWYGALATYYVCLALFRGGVLLYHKRRRGGRKGEEKGSRAEAFSRAKIYRNCGIILLILNVALSSAIAQMIFDDRGFSYAGWTIFAYAAYAFYKITMSVINLFRAKKQDDLTVQAVRNINLTDAAVSILALQTALLATFQTGEVNISLFNTLTGIAVSAVAVTLGIVMIVRGVRAMKRERITEEGEKTGGEQI